MRVRYTFPGLILALIAPLALFAAIKLGAFGDAPARYISFNSSGYGLRVVLVAVIAVVVIGARVLRSR